jgi:hypothetical protein
MHALFALEDRSLELINTLFATIFFDFVRLMQEYWDPLVQAIYDGKVPDFEGVESVKHHLQVYPVYVLWAKAVPLKTNHFRFI